MSDESDRDAAYDELITLAQPNALPQLSNAEIEEILDRNQRAQRWSAGVSLSVGQVVMPTVRNGHVYRVIEGGISTSTEPAWPTGTEDTVVEGAVTLVEAGADFANVYNVRSAAEECWALKERKAVQLSVAGESLNQVAQQCREQRQSLASVLIG